MTRDQQERARGQRYPLIYSNRPLDPSSAGRMPSFEAIYKTMTTQADTQPTIATARRQWKISIPR